MVGTAQRYRAEDDASGSAARCGGCHRNRSVWRRQGRGAVIRHESAVGCTAATRMLFDHLVGAGEHRRWQVETERLGSLEIDYQLVFGRRLHRQVGRLRPPEDAINISGRAAVLVENIWSI